MAMMDNGLWRCVLFVASSMCVLKGESIEPTMKHVVPESVEVSSQLQSLDVSHVQSVDVLQTRGGMNSFAAWQINGTASVDVSTHSSFLMMPSMMNDTSGPNMTSFIQEHYSTALQPNVSQPSSILTTGTLVAKSDIVESFASAVLPTRVLSSLLETHVLSSVLETHVLSSVLPTHVLFSVLPTHVISSVDVTNVVTHTTQDLIDLPSSVAPGHVDSPVAMVSSDAIATSIPQPNPSPAAHSETVFPAVPAGSSALVEQSVVEPSQTSADTHFSSYYGSTIVTVMDHNTAGGGLSADGGPTAGGGLSADGGLSAGGHAAVAIVMTICVFILLAVGYVFYKKYTHRSFKAFISSSVRYKTYSNASYRDDEGNLILPDRR